MAADEIATAVQLEPDARPGRHAVLVTEDAGLVISDVVSRQVHATAGSG